MQATTQLIAMVIYYLPPPPSQSQQALKEALETMSAREGSGAAAPYDATTREKMAMFSQ